LYNTTNEHTTVSDGNGSEGWAHPVEAAWEEFAPKLRERFAAVESAAGRVGGWFFIWSDAKLNDTSNHISPHPPPLLPARGLVDEVTVLLRHLIFEDTLGFSPKDCDKANAY